MMPEPLTVVLAHGRQAGSSRVRAWQWVETTGISASFHDYTGAVSNRPDVLIRHPLRVAAATAGVWKLRRRRHERLLLQREASPWSNGHLEAAILGRADLSIFDFDDALQWDTGRPLGYPALRPKKLVMALRAADRVIAGNTTLADYASSVASDVIVIPSCVDPTRYRMKSNFEVNDPPLLGWIGSSSGERFLSGIGPALLEVNRLTGARIQVVSAKGSRLAGLESIVDRTLWTERRGQAMAAVWDIGLSPLGTGLYERGKCGYKLLEYAASGLPSVASPVGVCSRLIEELGFLGPRSMDDWIESLLTLLHSSSEERSKIGIAARSAVESNYSYEAWRDLWASTVGEASRVHRSQPGEC